MANSKVTALPGLSSVADGDKLYIIDVSDLTDGVDGTSKHVTYVDLVAGLAASGANSDITSLSGITTPLSVAQGGSGAATLTGILKGNGTSAFTAVTAPSGDLVGTSDTQTLSNKTHSGDFKLAGASDNIQVNSADPKRGIYVDASAMKSPTTSGAAAGTTETSSNKLFFDTKDFDASSDEYVQFRLPSPDYWDAGTITAKLYWTAASSSGDVIWGVQGVALSNDDALDTAWGTAQTVTDTLTATGDLCVTSATAAVTLGNSPTAGDYILFRVYRDADAVGDTLGADAKLIGVSIKFSRGKYDDQ